MVEKMAIFGLEEEDSDQQYESVQEFSAVANNDYLERETASALENFAEHGGDPRILDPNRCLLISSIPSVLLRDPFMVFSDYILDWIAQDFKVSRDGMEKVIRIPKLQTDAESPELALRAIISFKSRADKNHVFAKKKLAAESSIKLSVLDSIPQDFIELEENLELADEVDRDDESADGNDEIKDHVDFETAPKSVETDKTSTHRASESAAKSNKDAQNGAKPSKRKEYVDEKEEVPFEISWEGAPEFQWRLCHTPVDARRLIIENLFWADLQNVFIYRVMLKAETVDISFPMRYNIEGSKQMCGKLTMTFQWSMQIMNEAMQHLIYVRCPDGRRIKIFLPQTPTAVNQKEEFESKLGRVIQPTRRMHQLVVKVLPNNYELSLETAQAMFAPHNPTEVENVKDDIDQPCAIVTMANVEETVKAHSSISFVTIEREGKEDWRCHVFLHGVEAHYGSLLTRWDKKKLAVFDSAKKTAKRSSADNSKTSNASHVVKKMRPNGPGTRRGTTTGGVYAFYPSRGSYKARGERVGSYGYSYGGAPSFDSRYHRDLRTRDQHEIDMEERILKQQEMLNSMAMAAKLHEQRPFTGFGNRRSSPSYGGSVSSHTSSYPRSNYDSYDRFGSSYY